MAQCLGLPDSRVGFIFVVNRLSCSMALGIFPDQGSNPGLLHWQVDSSRHQGRPQLIFVVGCSHPSLNVRSVKAGFLCICFSHLRSQVLRMVPEIFNCSVTGFFFCCCYLFE